MKELAEKRLSKRYQLLSFALEDVSGEQGVLLGYVERSKEVLDQGVVASTEEAIFGFEMLNLGLAHHCQ